jgi:hypothetical protein
MTNLKTLITPTALLAAFTFAAAPTFAQERAHGRQGSGQQNGQQSGQRAQPRSEGQRPQAGSAPRVETRQEAPRAQQARPAEAPRGQQARPSETPRAQQQQQQQQRGDYRGNDNRRNDAHAVPRGNVYAPHYDQRSYPRYSPRVYAPRVYGPRSYYRPYVFRPRFSIGFGIYAGYPVPYTYSYPYPIPVYGYGAPRSEVLITPGTTAYGGVALEITPYDADVFVDGQYAGKVQDFDGTTQPLTLAAGTHRIEIQAPGYQPMTVDVGIQPGQVVPYRGDLQQY